MTISFLVALINYFSALHLVDDPAPAAATTTAGQEISTEPVEVDAGELEDEVGLEENEGDHLQRQLLNAAMAKRITRNERLDNRRYHTAGAIEDIKVPSHI